MAFFTVDKAFIIVHSKIRKKIQALISSSEYEDKEAGLPLNRDRPAANESEQTQKEISRYERRKETDALLYRARRDPDRAYRSLHAAGTAYSAQRSP